MLQRGTGVPVLQPFGHITCEITIDKPGGKGVTGTKLRRENATLRLVRAVRKQSNIPIMVGFGISKRKHAEAMIAAGADGVVVGSAYARIYAENLRNPFETLPEIAKLAHEIKLGCISGYANRQL